MDKKTHNENIKEQFSKQATSYTAVAAHRDSLEVLIEMSGVSNEDTVLDIACGSGIVTCEFAKHTREVTGIDITKGMLDEAKKLQMTNNLTNINWILDDVVRLQFLDNHFSIVVTRFSFHHFRDYKIVFDEMIRVCKPNGTIMVVDVAISSDNVKAYDEMEQLRDSSHTEALTIEIFETLFQNDKLKDCQKSGYRMEIELETQLNASCLNDEDRRELRSMITQDIGQNNLGVNVALKDNKYFLYYPISIYVAQKK